MEPERDLILEDARSIREGNWRMAHLVQDAAELLDSKIEDENLDGQAEVVEVREAGTPTGPQSLEVSEELDAYQQRYARARKARALLTENGVGRLELARA